MTDPQIATGSAVDPETGNRRGSGDSLERGPVPLAHPRTAPTYVRAVHPDHGEAVTYVPGELLPEWLADAIDAGGFSRDPRTGTLVVDDASTGKARSVKRLKLG